MLKNKLPPLPKPKFTKTIRGVLCLTVTEHEHLMHVYAISAVAQLSAPTSGNQIEVENVTNQTTKEEEKP